MKVLWKLEDAVTIIREMQPFAMEASYALSLGGGVLNMGWSWKDLDITAVPASHEEPNLSKLLRLFVSRGYKHVATNRNHPGLEVYKFADDDRRIDLIVPFLDKTKNSTPVNENANRFCS